MKRIAWVAVAVAAVGLAACEKPQDDMQNLPGPNGLNADGSPPREAAPRAPDPGTYTGTSSNPRPPVSGINADPSNPNGAPGTR